MAEAPCSLKSLFQCQICFDEFEQDGSHVPRLLPCTHTLCHACIGRLIQGNKIECPECRKNHEATNKEKTFPQNKYLLTQIKMKLSQEQPNVHEFQKCKEHGKELSLFCLDPECNKPICRSCLKKEHKKHEITEIEDQEKEVLIKEVMKIKRNLEAKMNLISTAKKDITERTNAVVVDLKKTKEEIVSRIDKMINEAEGQNRIENIHVDNELSAMNSSIDLLSSIQQNIADEEDMSYEEIMNHRDIVARVSEHNTKIISGVRSFMYPVYLVDKSSEKYNFGIVKTEEITINLPEPEYLSHEKMSKIPTITNASQLKYLATKITNTQINRLNSFTVLNDEIGVISGDESESRKIKSYNLQTLRKLHCITSKDARGLAEVNLGGKISLAVSYILEQKIEFRDVNDFNQILLTHSVAPHEPRKLCAVNPYTLLYVDISTTPNEIHWLDLSESQLKPAAGKRVIHIKQNDIYDMCCTLDGQLMILAVGQDGIFSYNTITGKLEWKVDRKPPGMEKDLDFRGVTTDKHGHLFVSDWMDGNECRSIHLFRASDGQHLGCLMKDKEELGNPGIIHWCEKSSSLIAACSFKEGWHINVISVQF